MLNCDLLNTLFCDLAQLTNDMLFDPDFYSIIIRELVRTLGGKVPEEVFEDTKISEVFRKYLKFFGKCELARYVISAFHFHPCEMMGFIEELKKFFERCEEIFFYPLEDTIHLALWFPGRAVSFPKGEMEASGYLSQLADICGVSMRIPEDGKCGLICEDEAFTLEEFIHSADRLVILGRKTPRYDVEKVMKIEPSVEERAIFLKPDGKYSEILKKYPLFLDFLVESLWNVEKFEGKVPLNEVAIITRVERSRFVEDKAILLKDDEVRIIEGETVPKGSILIRTDFPLLVKEILSSRTLKPYLKSVPIESIPIPKDKTDKDAEEFLKHILELEKRYLGLL